METCKLECYIDRKLDWVNILKVERIKAHIFFPWNFSNPLICSIIKVKNFKIFQSHINVLKKMNNDFSSECQWKAIFLSSYVWNTSKDVEFHQNWRIIISSILFNNISMQIKNRLSRAFQEKNQRGSFDLEDFTAMKFFHIYI